MKLNSPSLELFGGVILIFFGVVFLVGFGLDPQDLFTDAIFIVFGALLIRNARQKSKTAIAGSIQRKNTENARETKKSKSHT